MSSKNRNLSYLFIIFDVFLCTLHKKVSILLIDNLKLSHRMGYLYSNLVFI